MGAPLIGLLPVVKWQHRRSVRQLWLQADFVIYRALEALLAAQVSFRRLYRNVSQQELDLFKLATRGAARMCCKLRMGAGVQWWEVGNSGITQRRRTVCG